jgi:hypothetical protein
MQLEILVISVEDKASKAKEMYCTYPSGIGKEILVTDGTVKLPIQGKL